MIEETLLYLPLESYTLSDKVIKWFEVWEMSIKGWAIKKNPRA